MSSDSTSSSPRAVDELRLLRHDAGRLIRQLQRIQRAPANRRDADRERWDLAYAAALERFDERASTKFSTTYDPELPISNYRSRIIDLLQNRQVIVVCGETGSGKSTQLPKMCLEAGLGKYGWIGHTQPRRLAARSIANRLSEELETKLGEGVGYKVRFNDQTQSKTWIKLMTDGVLLAEIHRDPKLEAYDCIIIDEAHERSINIDLLMAYLCRLIPERPELRIVITSATIDAERFSEHFCDSLGRAPIVNVEGRSYPVEIRYHGSLGVREAQWQVRQGEQGIRNDEPDAADDQMTRFCDAVSELFAHGPGDILAFFPTEREIRDAAKRLRGHLVRNGYAERTEVLPLYARLTEAEQQRVFQPHKKQRIVLATNVAESSLTVPGIRYVIDTGTARISRFAAKSRVQRLPIEPICQASANQRSGRCGRLGPGIAIRLYDESDYLARPNFAQPEIRRCDLASTILHAKSLGIDDIESLPWLDPPRSEAVNEGLNALSELGAIDEEDQLTSIGKRLAHWPVSPRIGRMLLEADKNGALHDVLIIAAGLETQDPRVRPPEQSQSADAAHQRFRDPDSDFLSLIRIWDFYHNLREKLGRSRLEKACRDSFLSFVRLREWGDVHRQLVEQCREMGFHVGKRKIELKENDFEQKESGRPPIAPESQRRFPNGYDAIHQSILAGQLSGIAMMDDVGKYRGAGNMELQLWPGSNLKNSKAKWIVCSEIIETTQRYARTVARIEVEWLERIAQHRIKFSYDGAHFSRKNGSAMVMKRGSLYGLPVVARHAVPLAPLDAKLARQLLIEHGLAEGELVTRARFWQHNLKFLEEVKKIGDKTRQRNYVIDPYVLNHFYQRVVPDSVVDRASLEAWDKNLKPPADKSNQPASRTAMSSATQPTAAASSPYLQWSDLSIDVDSPELEKQFPDRLHVGVSQLPLRYRFEPGDDADGVTVVVPSGVLPQLHKERLEWLVPGLLEEKLVALFKSLPKSKRRNLVPIPDSVRCILPELHDAFQRSQPFWKSVCDAASRRAGESISPMDFDVSSIPQHLRMRIESLDEQGKSARASRDLDELQRAPEAKPASSESVSHKPIHYEWQREAIEQWDIESLPKSVIEMRSGVRIERFPTLTLRNEKLATTIVDQSELAEQMLREGLIHLFSRVERREIRSQIQYLPNWSNASMWLGDRFKGEGLRDWVGDLLARLAFVETNWQKGPSDFEPGMRSKVEYDIVRLKRVERISLASAEIGRWLPKLAEAYKQVRTLLEQSPASWKPTIDSIRLQVAAYFEPSHRYHVPWVYLREIPRYLQAVAARVDKLKSLGIAKDQAAESPALTYLKAYQLRLQAMQQPSSPNAPVVVYPQGALLEFRWMIEEFRVSVHAQKLGTRVSVSPKRLDKMLEQLK